jgi:5-methylcytosine-specific restriction endonuclease McrA
MKEEVKQKVLDAIKESPLSMALAAKIAGMHYRTFIERAKKLGVYNPNQSGKGCNKTKPKHLVTPLNDILKGKHPEYQTNKLKIRLLKEGIFDNKCDCCGISEWNNQPISLELDHIDGVSYNHKLDNLQILCPNCHSQTPTFRGRNKKLNNLK